MSYNDPTFKYLCEQAEPDREGIAKVREACRRFLLRKTLAIEQRTKRLPIKDSWKQFAYFKQYGVCLRCHNDVPMKEANYDHIQALAQGGKHEKWNIRMLCKSCNSKKGSNTLQTESKLTGQTYMEQIG